MLVEGKALRNLKLTDEEKKILNNFSLLTLKPIIYVANVSDNDLSDIDSCKNYLKVKELCKKYNRLDDLIVIELNGIYTYNPLHKPNLKASVIADRLKEILLLFSPNNSESYWIDKAHQVLTEAIKICRIYNNGYVTFEEIHKLITNQYYYQEKIPILKDLFIKNKLSKEDIYNLYASLNFFEKEFFSLDSRTISILKSEITRITNCFISDYNVYNTFCPSISRP